MASQPKSPSKISPLKIAQAVAGDRAPAPSWEDDLDPEIRKEIVEAAKQMISGKLRNKQAIVNAWAKAGIPVTYNRLVGLLGRIKRGSIK